MLCGSEDLIHYSDGTQCQRCGGMHREEGGVEYDPDELIDRMERYFDTYE